MQTWCPPLWKLLVLVSGFDVLSITPVFWTPIFLLFTITCMKSFIWGFKKYNFPFFMEWMVCQQTLVWVSTLYLKASWLWGVINYQSMQVIGCLESNSDIPYEHVYLFLESINWIRSFCVDLAHSGHFHQCHWSCFFGFWWSVAREANVPVWFEPVSVAKSARASKFLHLVQIPHLYLLVHNSFLIQLMISHWSIYSLTRIVYVLFPWHLVGLACKFELHQVDDEYHLCWRDFKPYATKVMKHQSRPESL